jgi:hypothetical protein
MEIGDIVKISSEYPEKSVVGVEVRIINVTPEKLFLYEAEVLSGEYAGESWLFHARELMH